MNSPKWPRLERKTIHQGHIIQLQADTFLTPDGVERVFDIVEHPGAAVIIPMISNNEVLMINQYRPAAGRPLLEFPAGCVDEGEDPQATAVRELKEETGYTAGKLELLFSAYTTPGFTNEQAHYFLATDLTREGDQELDDSEFIDVTTMKLSNLRVQMRAGNIKNGIAVAALGYLMTFKPQLGKAE